MKARAPLCLSRAAIGGVAAFALGLLVALSGASPAGAAGSQQIVFSSLSSPQGLWRMNADGNSPQPFIPGATWPDYSKDGSKLVYQIGGSGPCNVNFGPGTIVVTNADRTDPITIGSGCSPRISPDGTHVLYLQIANGSDTKLYVASVSDPTHPTLLFRPIQSCINNVKNAYPAYPDPQDGNPPNIGLYACEPGLADWIDNANIAYTPDYFGGVWAVPASGGTPHPLITSSNRCDLDSDWYQGLEVSQDGRTIAGHIQAHCSPGTGPGIATLPVSGGSPHVILPDPGGATSESYGYPQWSSDGTQLALLHYVKNGVDHVAVMPSGGGAPRDINTADNTAAYPTFGPASATHKLTIRTLDDQFNAIPNEAVHVAGTGGSTTASTGPSGTATLDEPPGDYTVQSAPADGTFKPLKSGDCTVAGLACAVHLDKDRSVILQAPRDKLEFHFSPSSVNADGLASSVFNGEVDDLDPTGAPVSGVSLKFTPPVESPKALVCSPTGLLYPQLVGNSIAFNPFRIITAGDGSVHFTVHLGTEPGGWPLDAAELNKRVPAMGSIDLPFGSAPRRLPADVAQRIYDVVLPFANPKLPKQQIFGLSGPGPFDDPAADQSVLLAFLGGNLGALPDFGPIHTSQGAALEFYDATGRTAVLDTHVAKTIVDAALNKRPLPANVVNLPTLAQYEAGAGPTNHGTLMPQPEGQLTYFGFPYPPLSQSGEIAASFFDECLRPDALYYHVDVHSPVRLLFTDPRGRRFGLSASGRAVRGGAGLMVTDKAHHTTTFVIPADRYKIAFSASGNGQATIVTTTPGQHTERGQLVSFPVRKGQTGSASLGAGGLGRSVKFGGHSYKVAAGVGLRIHLSPSSIHHARGTRSVKIVVSDQFGRALASAAVTVLRGKTTIASVLTDMRGTVTVLVPRAKKGHLVVKVLAAAARAASANLTIT